MKHFHRLECLRFALQLQVLVWKVLETLTNGAQLADSHRAQTFEKVLLPPSPALLFVSGCSEGNISAPLSLPYNSLLSHLPGHHGTVLLWTEIC